MDKLTEDKFRKQFLFLCKSIEQYIVKKINDNNNKIKQIRTKNRHFRCYCLYSNL